MLIKQISIFLPNQEGHLAKVTKVLLEHNIDIRAIVAFDTAEYGILRAIVTEPDRAVELLKQDGFVAKTSKVIVVEPEDRTGSLHELFAILSENHMNIEYTYCFVMKKNTMPYFVLKVDELEKAAEVLTNKGIKVINKVELCS
jgi:hypothetical protein